MEGVAPGRDGLAPCPFGDDGESGRAEMARPRFRSPSGAAVVRGCQPASWFDASVVSPPVPASAESRTSSEHARADWQL